MVGEEPPWRPVAVPLTMTARGEDWPRTLHFLQLVSGLRMVPVRTDLNHALS